MLDIVYWLRYLICMTFQELALFTSSDDCHYTDTFCSVTNNSLDRTQDF
jgi:hypothetical protein